MPCRSNGKPGYKWGESGKCYTYTPGNKQSREAARKKAKAFAYEPHIDNVIAAARYALTHRKRGRAEVV
jgi:hypothetical protein